MPSPQLERGYTRIANELLDALARIRIPGEARQVLDVIIRLTYGYQRKETSIALEEFVRRTEIKKPNVVRAIKRLQEMGLITVIKKDNERKFDLESIGKYSINKNFEKQI